jgi:hypothetical protein
VLGSTPERGTARAAALNVPRAYATLDELADPRCDDRPPQTCPVPELGPRSRAPQADLVEDQDEGIERDVRDRHVHGAILGATFALDEPKTDHR